MSLMLLFSNNDSDYVTLKRIPLFYSTIHIILVKLQRFCLIMTADDNDASVKLHRYYMQSDVTKGYIHLHRISSGLFI